MLRSLVVLVWLVLTAPAVSQTAPSQRVQAPDPAGVWLEAAAQRASAPGLAWAIIEAETVHLGARGERVAGSGLAVDPDTPFALGSISKSFTALAILQLVEAGQVDLDRGIGTYLDAFAGQPGEAITLRQLLSHTSGYSTLQGNQFAAAPDGEADTLERRMRSLAQAGPAGATGQGWAYSNANYVILGALIEAESGMSYAAYVQTRILTPLGMAHSFVGESPLAETMAIGHTPWFFGRRAIAAAPADGGEDPMAPAGGVVASAADMARYLVMMMNGADDLISAEHKTLMMTPASAAAPHYGLGWFLDAEADAALHTGLTPGVETMAVISRSQSRAGVILVNANSGMGFGVTGDVLAGFAALVLGDTPTEGGGHAGPQSLYLMALGLPVLFLAGIAMAWRGRAVLRAKTGAAGLFSLAFPIVPMLAMAWVFLDLMPKMFGAPLATFNLYQPDMTIGLVASSVTGVAFALARLAVGLTGRR